MISIEDAWAIVEHDPKFNTEGIVLGRAADFRDEGQKLLVMEVPGRLAPSHRVTLWPSSEGELLLSRWYPALAGRVEELRHQVRFAIVAIAVAEAYREHNSEEIRRHKEEAAQEVVRRQEAVEARKATLAEREETLLHEHVGDQVRLRLRGEQSLHGAFIDTKEGGEGEFFVCVNWMKDSNYGKHFDLSRVMCMDIMIGSRYCELWNDGYEDLLPYEAEKVRSKRKKIKKCK